MSAAAPPVLTSPVLSAPHAMTRRAGGVSAGPFAELNLAFGLGDADEHVRENRRRALSALSAPGPSGPRRPPRLVSLKQVHGAEILCLRAADGIPEAEEHHGFDAVITDAPGLALLIRQADCQAVLLHEPRARVVAAVHCGWRGSAAGIIGRTVARMRTDFGADPALLEAVIAPSLGPCCAEFVNFRRELPEWMWAFAADKPAHFDFWAMSRRQLLDAGLRPERVALAGVCTRCSAEYFSFRRAKQESGGLCGRHGSLIALPPE